jgi:hypothetical protein
MLKGSSNRCFNGIWQVPGLQISEHFIPMVPSLKHVLSVQEANIEECGKIRFRLVSAEAFTSLNDNALILNILFYLGRV